MKFIKLALAFLCLNLFFPVVHPQNFIIKGGQNIANILDKDDGKIVSDDYDIKISLHFGLGLDVPLSSTFSIEPGLLITGKGSVLSDNSNYYGSSGNYGYGYEYGYYDYSSSNTEYILRLTYLELPLYLKANVALNADKSSKFYIAVGPYLGYILSGKGIKYENGEKDKVDIEFGMNKATDFLKPYEIGLTLGSGFIGKDFMVGLSYDRGLTNIYTNGDSKNILKNRVFKLSIGYVIQY